jgi:hypothetical protein
MILIFAVYFIVTVQCFVVASEHNYDTEPNHCSLLHGVWWVFLLSILVQLQAMRKSLQFLGPLWQLCIYVSCRIQLHELLHNCSGLWGMVFVLFNDCPVASRRLPLNCKRHHKFPQATPAAFDNHPPFKRESSLRIVWLHYFSHKINELCATRHNY